MYTLATLARRKIDPLLSDEVLRTCNARDGGKVPAEVTRERDEWTCFLPLEKEVCRPEGYLYVPADSDFPCANFRIDSSRCADFFDGPSWKTHKAIRYTRYESELNFQSGSRAFSCIRKYHELLAC